MSVLEVDAERDDINMDASLVCKEIRTNFVKK